MKHTDKPTTTASARPENVREYYEIQNSDIGRALISAFGRKWSVCDFIGRIMTQDVGKRVYRFGDVLQVENDEQRAKRTASAPETRIDAAELAYRESNPNWQYDDYYNPAYAKEQREKRTETAKPSAKQSIPAEKPTVLDAVTAACKQWEIEYDKLQTHADKLAEALRILRDACNVEQPDEFVMFASIERATGTLAAYESEVRS